MKKLLPDLLVLLLIFSILIAFFWPMFWPQLQLLVTPDFGRSDAFDLSFSMKYLLDEALKENKLPIWSAAVGNGFPLLGEGETGIFFLPNLLLYKFFDLVIAYNISLFITVAILTTGIYFWVRLLKFGILPSFYAAITIALSGLIVPHLTHLTLLQGFSLLPWVGAATLLLAQNPSGKALAFWSFLVSQQVFAGFPQATFITLLFAFPYYLWLIRDNPKKLPAVLLFIAALGTAIGLSAIQLVPSSEFLRNSLTSGGLTPEMASYFSFPLKHLLTFINPFALGNPRLGTYPAFYEFDGSIFWENSGYIGWLPWLLLGIALTQRRRQPTTIFFVALAIVAFLLMLGKYSPLYLIYSFWPFNLFRVPSRFLWLFILGIVMGSLPGLVKIQALTQEKPWAKFLSGALCLVNTGLLFTTWRSYHLFLPAAAWLKPPETLALIDKNQRIFPIGAEVTHNQTFLKEGWQRSTPYISLRNFLSPNTNIIWGITSGDVYAGRFLRRPTLLTNLLGEGVKTDKETGQTEVNELGSKLLNLLSVGTVIAPKALKTDTLAPAGAISGETAAITVYRNPTSFPRAYLASRVAVVRTVNEALAKIKDPAFVPGEWVLLEKPLEISSEPARGFAEITKDSDTLVEIRVKDNAITKPLVLTDTYYPGWQAYLDGQPTKILPANLAQRAVIVPPGSHVVVFRYEPESLRYGAIISGLSLLVIIFLIILPPLGAPFRIH
ncbi:MAG: YfhO family protein [Patescibacteria group bacterium]